MLSYLLFFFMVLGIKAQATELIDKGDNWVIRGSNRFHGSSISYYMLPNTKNITIEDGGILRLKPDNQTSTKTIVKQGNYNCLAYAKHEKPRQYTIILELGQLEIPTEWKIEEK